MSLEKRKSRPRRSVIKPYEPDKHDKELRKQLDEWRRNMSNDKYGRSFTKVFGYSTFMPDKILNCIVNAAHKNLITSVEKLAKETRWHHSKEYGQAVVEIILGMCPRTDQQLRIQTPASVVLKSGPKPREMVCTSCGQPGHSSEFSGGTCNSHRT